MKTLNSNRFVFLHLTTFRMKVSWTLTFSLLLFFLSARFDFISICFWYHFHNWLSTKMFSAVKYVETHLYLTSLICLTFTWVKKKKNMIKFHWNGTWATSSSFVLFIICVGLNAFYPAFKFITVFIHTTRMLIKWKSPMKGFFIKRNKKEPRVKKRSKKKTQCVCWNVERRW